MNQPGDESAPGLSAAGIIAQAHAAGLKTFGGTLTPFKGAGHYSAAGEVKRETVNRWSLTSGAAGDQAMANAIPLRLLLDGAEQRATPKTR